MTVRAKFVVVATVLSLAAASSETGWFGSEFSVVQKVYEDCQNKNDIVGCLKGKALGAINKAVEQVREQGGSREELHNTNPRRYHSQESLSVLDGVAFVKQNETQDAPSIVEGRFMNGLTGVDKALANSLDRFFKTHSLKLDMSSEGRGKLHDKLDEIKEKRGKRGGAQQENRSVSHLLPHFSSLSVQARRSSEAAVAAAAETREARSTDAT